MHYPITISLSAGLFAVAAAAQALPLPTFNPATLPELPLLLAETPISELTHPGDSQLPPTDKVPLVSFVKPPPTPFARPEGTGFLRHPTRGTAPMPVIRPDPKVDYPLHIVPPPEGTL